MSTVLDHIGEAVASRGLWLRKAMPRSPEHLLLVLEGAEGAKLAGQWYADPVRAGAVARETSAATGYAVDVPVLPLSGVLLQPAGADRHLPSLHRLATAPGTTLVAHRPERRAMVRRELPGGQVTYTKVVRTDRVGAMAARAAVAVPGVTVPRVLDVDAAAGTMTCASLGGRTLQRLLDDPSVPDTEVAAVGRRVGAAVARLHRMPPPADVGHHDAAAEAGVTRRWLERAAMHRLLDLDAPPLRESLQTALRLLLEPPCATTYLHRDLHDLQVLVDEHGEVGMLDFDLATTGEPALDLANLLVHLELHAGRRPATADRTARCAEAVVDGYQPGAEVWQRVPAYALATRLRLVAVNAFRPRRTAAARTLLTDPPSGPLREIEELV